MAWTATATFYTALAESSSLAAIFTGGSLNLYNSGATLLCTATVAASTGQGDGTVIVVFSASTVEAGIVSQTVSSAILKDSGGNNLITAGTVGTSASDVIFDSITGWNAADNVSPAPITFDITGVTVVTA